MNKLILSAAVAAALLSSSAFAAPSGGIDLTSGFSNVSGNYGNGKSLNLGGFLTLSPDTTVRANVTEVQAWHSSGTYFSAGVVQNLTDRLYVSGDAGLSSDTNILAKSRLTGTANYKFGEQKNLIGSIGYDHIEMRGSNKSDSLLLAGIWYVPNMPVVVQVDARLSNATPGDHKGELYGASVTYGHVGEWTVTGHVDSGIAGYESDIVVGQLVRYPSKHQSVTARYWVARDAGVQVALDNVSNDYYTRKELRTTLFYNF